MKAFVFTVLIGLTQMASAALVATWTPAGQTWDTSTKTHILVASKGLMFSSVAYQQAQVFSALHPKDQILFISNLPSSAAYQTTKQKQLKKMGFQIMEETNEPLTSDAFLDRVERYAGAIKTLSIISHNGVQLGPWLEDGDHRLDFTNKRAMEKLKPLFLPDAWVRIQGCNSGWNVARYLTAYWNVPVLASFTSTSFYYLTQEGTYELYQDQDDFKSGKAKPPAKEDTLSTGKTIKCAEGMCLTLIPESAPYHFQMHKSPDAAWLPMTKTVCDHAISDSRCQKALAESLLNSVGASSRIEALRSAAAFKAIVMQSVCGSHTSGSSQKKCVQNLEKTYAERTSYLPYKYGSMLKCGALRACEFEQVSIDLRKNKSKSATASIIEYIDQAMIGYQLLQ